MCVGAGRDSMIKLQNAGCVSVALLRVSGLLLYLENF